MILDPEQAAVQARAMLGNCLSKRLADGWYPSGRDPETGEVVHDRHVLIWVRSYEALLEALIADRSES